MGLFNAIRKIRKSASDMKAFAQKQDRLEGVADRIAVRLQPREWVERMRDTPKCGPLLCREEFEGIFSTIVYDAPEMAMTFGEDRLTVWNTTYDDVLKIGLKNVRAMGLSEITESKFREGMMLHIFGENEHPYAPTHLLFLTEYPQMIGKRGSLVSLPTAHAAFSHPLDEGVASVDTQLLEMLDLTYTFYEEGPNPISLDLYWYYNGRFTLIPHKVKDNNASFEIPQTLKDVLQ